VIVYIIKTVLRPCCLTIKCNIKTGIVCAPFETLSRPLQFNLLSYSNYFLVLLVMWLKFLSDIQLIYLQYYPCNGCKAASTKPTWSGQTKRSSG